MMISIHNSPWIQLAALSLILLNDLLHANINCPSTCNQIACDNGVLSCSRPGLTNIPTVLPPKTDKVILINQDFSKARDLSYTNISNYGPPEFKIVKITIQYSQLNGISSETFSHLHNLHTLDLSFNKLRFIEPSTFESLNLNFLRLDGNVKLQFHCSSFQKSIIRHLSLMNCSLTTIDYCTLKPIEGVLKKLMLSKNFLKTIDQKFDFLFQRLEEVRLANNIFQCSGCQLKWLSKVLKLRFTKFYHPNVSEKNLEEIFPKCFSPQYLSDSFIHKLIDTDFVCSSPAIKSIDVVVDKFEKLTLSCNSFSVDDKIVWMRNLDSRKLFKSHTTIDVHRTDAQHQYHCMVSNREGNVSTRLNINWQQTLTNGNDFTLSTNPVTTFPDSTLYRPRFSLLELIAAVVATFTIFLVAFIIVVKYSLSQRENKLFQYPVIVECKKHLPALRSLNEASLKSNYNYQDTEAIRYDWSGNPSFGNSQTYDVPVVARGSVFLDFKTHEEIQRS